MIFEQHQPMRQALIQDVTNEDGMYMGICIYNDCRFLPFWVVYKRSDVQIQKNAFDDVHVMYISSFVVQ